MRMAGYAILLGNSLFGSCLGIETPLQLKAQYVELLMDARGMTRS